MLSSGSILSYLNSTVPFQFQEWHEALVWLCKSKTGEVLLGNDSMLSWPVFNGMKSAFSNCMGNFLIREVKA